MGGQPYWHVGLREESPPPHWNILDPFYAKHIEDYRYGENWLAYRRRDGFFSISFTNKAGETSTLYTRDGSFQMNSEGYLVTKDGDYVLGESGDPIVLPTDISKLTVDSTGRIYADGQYVDTFGIVDFEDYNYIEAYGENLYRAVDGATFKDSTASVNQGYLETSNINVVSEMVDMINIAREFESNQKIVNSIDEMLGKMVSISEL